MGEPREAEKALRDLAEVRSDEPGPWIQLLLFQAGRGETDEAIRTVEEMRKRVKHDRPEFLFAQAYRIAGDPKLAAEQYREALKKWPKDPEIGPIAANFFLSQGSVGDAEAVLQSVLKVDQKASWAARQLAMILSDRPRDAAAWKKAWGLVNPNTPGAPDTPQDRLTRAIVLLRSPDPNVSAKAVAELKGLKDDLPRQSAIGSEAPALLVRFFMAPTRRPRRG